LSKKRRNDGLPEKLLKLLKRKLLGKGRLLGKLAKQMSNEQRRGIVRKMDGGGVRRG
jgi:hypothetical protein